MSCFFNVLPMNLLAVVLWEILCLSRVCRAGFRCFLDGIAHSQNCVYNRGTCPTLCRQLDLFLLGSLYLPPLTGAGMNFSRAEIRLWALDRFLKHSFSWHVQQTQIWLLLPHLVLHQCYCLLQSLILKRAKWLPNELSPCMLTITHTSSKDSLLPSESKYT